MARLTGNLAAPAYGVTLSLSLPLLPAPHFPTQVTVTDNGSLTFTQAFTIIINYVAAPPGVSSTSMSIPENSVSGSLVGTMTSSGPVTYTFTPIAAGTSPASALTVFRVQACSGTVFVNTVRAQCAASRLAGD